MTPIRLTLITLLLGAGISISQAQTTVPANPKKFETRKNGSSTGTGSSVGLITSAKKPKKRTITITYTVLSKEREWENSEGEMMKARLLAFPSLIENNKESTTNGDKHFTVIRDQKVRFLMSHNSKPTIYPLDKLSNFDQEYIEEIAQAAARAAKAASSKQKNNAKDTGIQTGKPSTEK